MASHFKKYVVVLAHADGWGALSANKVVRHIHETQPDVGIYLVVSRATKDKEGRIATKLEDLRNVRELKETNLQTYFDRIDAMYESGAVKRKKVPQYFTFKQLAKRFCADGEVHFTTRGGPKGGEEVEAFFKELETKGQTPEVVLSVDTMAILPASITGKYHCFSTHPGPLDTIKIEGMQGTLRSLTYQVLYDEQGEPLPSDYILGMGLAYVKGTLFMQHPELDKGPPIKLVQTPVIPGMCAYRVRDEVYHVLTDEMLKNLPVFLDKDRRTKLVQEATREKERVDALPHQRIPELEPERFATWQGNAVGFPNEEMPHGIEVIQNAIVDPIYFKNQMRRYFPGKETEFEKTFNEIYQPTIGRVEEQRRRRVTDPWTRLLSGEPGITITQYDPKTRKPRARFGNPPSSERS